MRNSTIITFPLSDRPTHYIACLEDAKRIYCTHVSVKLVPSTLIPLVCMHFVASVLRQVGIKISAFETRVGALDVSCLRYTGQQFLEASEDTSCDDAPYDCLSLGELADLGGYATDAVLDAHFAPITKEAKVYAIEVHAERFSMWLKIHFFGQVLSIETNPFNLDIIVKDFLTRSVLNANPECKTIEIWD